MFIYNFDLVPKIMIVLQSIFIVWILMREIVFDIYVYSQFLVLF